MEEASRFELTRNTKAQAYNSLLFQSVFPELAVINFKNLHEFYLRNDIESSLTSSFLGATLGIGFRDIGQHEAAANILPITPMQSQGGY